MPAICWNYYCFHHFHIHFHLPPHTLCRSKSCHCFFTLPFLFYQQVSSTKQVLIFVISIKKKKKKPDPDKSICWSLIEHKLLQKYTHSRHRLNDGYKGVLREKSLLAPRAPSHGAVGLFLSHWRGLLRQVLSSNRRVAVL